MNDFGFPKRVKKTVNELNVVPILDMFISIVFFLLLSASMVGMTKIVVPPSATKSIESNSKKIPLNPKLIITSVGNKGEQYKIKLEWGGKSPGSKVLTFKEDVFKEQLNIIKEINEMTLKFKEQYPEEKTIQISLQSDVPYQWLISAMDGVREVLPDIVLSSYTLADSMKE